MKKHKLHTYGLPYQGSKNTLAPKIVELFPAADSFLDACCGGGAVTHAAVLSGKFKKVTAVDTWEPILRLLRATMIKYGYIDYEHYPFVSKEEFDRIRRNPETVSDSVAMFTHSFGFKGNTYAWCPERVPMKRLVHEIVLGQTAEDRRYAFLRFAAYCRDNPPSREMWTWVRHPEELTSLSRIRSVEESMATRNTDTKLDIRCADLFTLDYDSHDVIYFDPPYVGTTKYRYKKFNHDRFESLLRDLKRDGKRVYVSEFECPAGYEKIASYDKLSLMNSEKNVKGRPECVWYSGV